MDFQKYNIKEEKKVTKIVKYIHPKFALKNRVSLFFFCKVMVGYKKMKIKGVIEDLKIKKKKNYSKNISRTFSGGVVGSVGSVHFQIVP